MRRGTIRRTILIGPPAQALVDDVRSAVIVVGQQALLLRGRDVRVQVLDLPSGTVRRTIPVGPHPVAVALDHRAERAIMVGAGRHHRAACAVVGSCGHPATAVGSVSMLNERQM